MMTTVAEQIFARLKPLLGLKLSLARRTADLRAFHFGPIKRTEKSLFADYTLHIQCPWRLENQDRIVTGRLDLWEPAQITPDIDWKSWDYNEQENLQDARLAAVLEGYDPKTRSLINETDILVVESISTDNYGGAALSLSGGYRLVIFPAGSRSEDWRLLGPDEGERHFVVSGGKIEQSGEAD